MDINATLIREIAYEQVSVSSTVARSGACPGHAVNINTPSVDCFYLVGPNVVAVASGNGSGFLSAGSIRDVLCNPGDVVSLITSSASGAVYVTHYEL